MGMGKNINILMAKRAAEEISDGMIVNLGIGLPSFVPDQLPNKLYVIFHSENGIAGIGPSPRKGDEDENLCNAGGIPVTLLPGGAYFDSAAAFGMIRKGLIDVTILGALQVSAHGDLANWIVPGKRVPGIGGAVELAGKSKKVIVMMRHIDKYGNSKLVKDCTLPLTAAKCVDVVITEMGVFSITETGMVLTDIFFPHSVDEIRNNTAAPFTVSEKLNWIGGM